MAIVVEGPDGAGKTSLIKHIVQEFEVEQAPRFATSEGGPLDHLFNQTWRDVVGWSPTKDLLVYDRHPLVSEYIYGPVCQGEISSGFVSNAAEYLMKRFRRDALLIVCLPPREVVRDNISKGVQMTGVRENIDTIWSLYQSLTVQWPGNRMLTYDYTTDGELSEVDSYTGLYQEENNQRRFI